MVQVVAFSIIGILILSLFVPLSTYATHESEGFVWQLVVVSSEPVCTLFHYQLVDKYQIVTEEYFKLYEFEETSYQPECYSIEKIQSKYDKPSNLDLLIFVYDRELGREMLHPLDMGGLYSHTGVDITHNHTIIFCECSTFYYSDPTWILSHELSHFILNYLGFDLSVVEDEIHLLDSKYDYCFEEEYDETCQEVKLRLDGKRLGHAVNVMTPYQPAIGQVLIKNTTGVDLDSKEIQLLQKITDWWTSGVLSNEQYSSILSLVTDVSVENLSNGIYLSESGTIIVGEPSKNKKLDRIYNQTESLQNSIIENFPFLEDGNPNPIFSGEYPQWYKTKAILWSSKIISDEEFFASLEALQNSALAIEEDESFTTDELLNEGIRLSNEGEYKKSLEFIDLALSKDSQAGILRVDTLLEKGLVLYLLERYSEALVYFDAVLGIEPGNVNALENKGHTFAQLGNLEKAKMYFELAILNQELE